MIRRVWLAGFLAFGVVAGPALGAELTPLPDAGLSGHYGASVGTVSVRGLNANHKRQSRVGGELEVGAPGRPLRFAVGVYRSESGIAVDGLSTSIGEFHLGIFEIYLPGSMHPYWGAGLAMAQLTVRSALTGQQQRYGWDPGYWAGGGFTLDLPRRTFTGLNLAWSGVRVATPQGNADIGGMSLSLRGGLRW
ncbi:MAG: hypothetical protein OEW11_05800 [Nitrospirota bacterium]|nr:hypothetical protein [Nitrospirota bacterium]